jgi:hypothetical protein
VFDEEQINPSDGAAGAEFGAAVDADGLRSIVGAIGRDGNRGAAYIFLSDSDGVWSQTQKLVATNGELDDHFGYQVAICGDYAFVGAPKRRNGGAVYVYHREAGFETWAYEATITAPDAALGDEFGHAVSAALSDGLVRVAIGAP